MNYDTFCYMDLCPPTKRNEVLIHATAWMKLVLCVASTMENLSSPLPLSPTFCPLLFSSLLSLHYLVRSGWPRTHNFPAFASWVMQLQACTLTPSTAHLSCALMKPITCLPIGQHSVPYNVFNVMASLWCFALNYFCLFDSFFILSIQTISSFTSMVSSSKILLAVHRTSWMVAISASQSAFYSSPLCAS